MNITLIHPRFAEGYQTPARLEPLALAVLAALTPKEHAVRAVDERLEEVPWAEPTDLVGISVCTFSARRAYGIAEKFRQRGVPVVLGGFHPTLQPGEAMAHADAVVAGDAEGIWPQVIEDAAAGRLARLYAAAPFSPPSGARTAESARIQVTGLADKAVRAPEPERRSPTRQVSLANVNMPGRRPALQSEFAGREPVGKEHEAFCEPLAMPDRSVFRGKRYLPIRLVQFGRGCPRNCEFCAVRAFYGGGARHRPVESVVEELKADGGRRVFFVDDNLLADRDAFRRLLEAIRPLRLRWSSQLDLGIADDPELLELARRSGCQSLIIGFESLSEGNLRQMGKSWNCASRFAARLARIRAAGIMIYGTFLFGYDEDHPDSFRRTVEFALRQRFFIANFNPLQPIPGTPLYERLRREARLVYDRWWMEPGYRWNEALVRPRGMTVDQLTAGCRWARERFHSLRGIARRLPAMPHVRSLDNLSTYLASNWISRRDIRIKSHLPEAAR